MATQEIIEIITRYKDEIGDKINKSSKDLSRFAESIKGLSDEFGISNDELIKNVFAQKKSISSLTKMGITLDKNTKSTKKINKETKSYSDNLIELFGNAGSSFRVLLPLMFGFQQAGQAMQSAIQPALDLVGVQQTYNQFLAIKYLPTALKQLDSVLNLGDAWLNQSEAQREAEGDAVLYAKNIADLISFTAQWGLALGAIGDILPTINLAPFGVGIEVTGRELATAIGVTFGFGSGLAVLSTEAGKTMSSIGGLGAAVGILASDKIMGLGTALGILKNDKLVPAKDAVNNLKDAINATKDKTINIDTNAPTTPVEKLKKLIDDLKDKKIHITTILGMSGVGGIGPSVSLLTILKAFIPSLGNLGSLLGFQHGGIVEETGPAFLHKGETIIPTNQSNTLAPNITINATVSSDYDVKRLATQLNRYWVADYEKMVKTRGVS